MAGAPKDPQIESPIKSLLERRFIELPPIDRKREIALLKRPKKGSATYRRIIQERGWRPLIVCDNEGCYWSGRTVIDRDNKLSFELSEAAVRELTLMLQDGEFGEEVKRACLDARRWWVIADALDPPDDELIRLYGCRYFVGIRLPGRSDEAVNGIGEVRFESRPFDPSRIPAAYRAPTITNSEEVAEQQERAARGHHAVLVSLHSHLVRQGWVDIQEMPGAIDLHAMSPAGHRTLFEAKTITIDNESEQCRAGLAQLLEYRFFLGSPDDHLCLVVDRRPTESRIRLLKHLRIELMTALDGRVTVIE